MVACGPGIERIAEETKARWPDANLIIADSESLGTEQAVRELVEKISSGEIDIIIGTQVLAKGHHFPNLTLVGVIDADIGLSSWDLRASERTHQLLHQVSGRAGREEKVGSVLIQTREAQSPVMQSLLTLDSASFLELEKDSRRTLNMPPFGRLVSIIVSGKIEGDVVKVVTDLGDIRPTVADVEFLGPAPAFIYRLRGKYRYRFLVKGPRNYLLQNDVRKWLGGAFVPPSVRIQVDVDPYNFY
jgi:primosomal protein N' (replication factor Y)